MIYIRIGNKDIYRGNLPDYMVPSIGDKILVKSFWYSVKEIIREFQLESKLIIEVEEEEE